MKKKKSFSSINTVFSQLCISGERLLELTAARPCSEHLYLLGSAGWIHIPSYITSRKTGSLLDAHEAYAE